MTTTGQDPGNEQLPHRDVGHHPVDHERQRRRDDRTQRCRRRRHADREAKVVALILHRLDLDRAKPRRVGDRRTRHAGEDDRADDVHMPEAALEPSDQRQREVVDAVGDAGVIHEIAGHDEKRHREQRKTVDAADHAVNDDERRQIARHDDVDQHRPRHRDGHRHAGGHGREEGPEQDRGHTDSSMSVSGRSRTLYPWRQWTIVTCTARTAAHAKPKAHTP